MLCSKAQRRSSAWGCLWRRIRSLRLPPIGPALLNGVQHAPRPGWWGWNCRRRRRRCWNLSPTRRRRLRLSARWRRRILAAKPQLKMPALKHLGGGGEEEEEVEWGDFWPSSLCWVRRKDCLSLDCFPSRRPTPGSPRGRSRRGCRRSLLPRSCMGRGSKWRRRRRRVVLGRKFYQAVQHIYAEELPNWSQPPIQPTSPTWPLPSSLSSCLAATLHPTPLHPTMDSLSSVWPDTCRQLGDLWKLPNVGICCSFLGCPVADRR